MAIKLALMAVAPDDIHVWAMLDDNDHNQNPSQRGESFVIGSGETLREAFRAAKQDLEKALGDLQVMAHDNGVQL